MNANLKNNRSCCRSASLVLIVFLGGAAIAQAQETLTNDAIVNMTKARVDATTIVDMIQRSPGKYVVTSSALIALKQQGVSDDAIRAMRAKTEGNAAPGQAATSKPAPPANPSSNCGRNAGHWSSGEKTDQITGVKTSFVEMCTDGPERGSKFKTTGTCDLSSVDFKIGYYESPSNLGYKLADDYPLPRPHAVMRLSIDGQTGVVFSKTNDYKNEATIRLFWDPTVFFGPIAKNEMTPSLIFKAQLVKIEMPLADGTLPILEIRPQDPVFQKFATQCQAPVEALANKAKGEAEAAEEQKRKTAAAAEAQRNQQALAAAAAAKQESQRAWQKYGAASINDSYWNLKIKAQLSDNQALIAQLGSSRSGVLGVHQVPGSACQEIFVPGDILPGQQLDWNAANPQTVYVRCHNFLGTHEFKVGQMEIDPRGLPELKMRRDQLLALGVSEKQAPAEPDSLVGPLPASWTTKKWFLCPPDQALPVDYRQKRVSTTAPMEVKFVGRNNDFFQYKLKSEPDGTYFSTYISFKESCSGAPARR